MKLSDVAKILNATVQGADCKFSGVSIDSRNIKKGNIFVAIKGENFDGHDFVEAAKQAGAAAAVVSRPESYSLPVIQVPDVHKAFIHWATVHRSHFNIPMIAITGSCGKTTTRALTASILNLCGPTLASKASFNNDIGVPLTLLQLKDQYQFVVQEVGANHPGEIAHLMKIMKPTVSVITCAAPVHIEGFGSLEGVAKAKAEIYEGLNLDGVAILNVDDLYSDFWKKKIHPRRTITFGLHHPADVQAKAIHLNNEAKPTFRLCIGSEAVDVQLQLIGEHNVMNALAAAAIAKACEVPIAVIKEGLEQAEAEKMRLQAKPGIKSTQVIDDSYNANPLAMLAALKVLRHHGAPRILVVGDMRELGPDAERYHAELGEQAREHEVDALYCLGPLTKATAEAFGHTAYWFEDMAELIGQLQTQVEPGSTILVKGSRSMGMDRVVKVLIQ